MMYICPYCGSLEQSDLYCSVCFKETRWVQELWNKSAVYYNKGLKAAKVRDLSLATAYLVKAITLNKYNIEARNLLGLIYYEVGQVGIALKQWIISHSLSKQNNIAAEYITRVQKKPQMLSHYKEAMQLYNQALRYLREKNIDMAIIRLKRVVSIHPKFVDAKVLLALSYMYNKQYYKANEQIRRALAIDEGHKEALLYLGALTKEEIKDLEPYENEVAHKKTKEVSLLIDRSRMLRRYLLYFLIGAIGMFLVERYLVMPSKLKEYRDEKKSLQESEASLMNKVQELSDEYQIKVAELEKNQRQLESEIADYEVQLGGLMQKEKISQANKMVDEKDYIEAARILYSVVSSKLDEENKTKWELLKETVYPKAVDQLYNEGMTLYQRNDFVEASTFFETLLIYEPEANTARKALYYLGCSNMAVDNLSGAKRYFERVEAEYANTREAILAKQKLEEIAKNQ